MITRNGQKVSMLAIDAVKARHRGNYTCFASNKGGIAHYSAYLKINGENYSNSACLTYEPEKWNLQFASLRTKLERDKEKSVKKLLQAQQTLL